MKKQTKMIGNKKFVVTPFGAKEAIRLQSKLAGVFAPAITKIIGGVDNLNSVSKVMETKLDGKVLYEAIQDFLGKLDEDTYILLLDRLFDRTLVETDGKEGKITLPLADSQGFELAFSCNTMLVFQVIFFVLQVNYPDFFKKVRNIG